MDVNALRLTTTDNVTINGENADIRIVPTGSAGTVLINPSAGGSIDNVNLGATTPGTVSATILTASAGTINNTKIGKNCIIGAKALIAENKEIPDDSLVLGSPGRIIRKVTEDEKEAILKNTKHYQDNWKRYSKSIF